MRASEILLAGRWDATQEVDRVLIDYDRRFRRRIVLTTLLGAEVLVDLPGATRLRDGDGLLVETGVVRVCAQSEDLMEIRSLEAGGLIRIAWHLGNRHLPVQLGDDCIRIRSDHVIGAMVQGLGSRVNQIRAPFDPEVGAYAGDFHRHDKGDDEHH